MSDSQELGNLADAVRHGHVNFHDSVEASLGAEPESLGSLASAISIATAEMGGQVYKASRSSKDEFVPLLRVVPVMTREPKDEQERLRRDAEIAVEFLQTAGFLNSITHIEDQERRIAYFIDSPIFGKVLPEETRCINRHSLGEEYVAGSDYDVDIVDSKNWTKQGELFLYKKRKGKPVAGPPRTAINANIKDFDDSDNVLIRGLDAGQHFLGARLTNESGYAMDSEIYVVDGAHAHEFTQLDPQKLAKQDRNAVGFIFTNTPNQALPIHLCYSLEATLLDQWLDMAKKHEKDAVTILLPYE